MQTNTPTTALSADAMARGTQIYNEIMAGIEPELLTESLPALKEKYPNETPEESQERGARYDAAFVEYDKRYAAYITDLNGKVRSLQRTVRAEAEQDSRSEDEAVMSTLESSMSNV